MSSHECRLVYVMLLLTNEITRGLDFAFAHIGVWVLSKSEEDHADRLHQLFNHLEEHGTTINTDKSILGDTAVEFLGHTINPKGISPLESANNPRFPVTRFILGNPLI